MPYALKLLVVTLVCALLLGCSSPGKPNQDGNGAIPAETLAAIKTAMPNVENVFNPQGSPVQEWNGVPIMPQATVGQEFTEKGAYSFKVPVPMKDVQDFYAGKLPALGWAQPYQVPSEEDAGLMIFQKGNAFLTIAITSSEDACVVILTLK
jgi:hypothetical protein